jgi:hypothetical protein
MPTRKQRRRELKAKRHEYEFVYVDADGNELEEAPPELLDQEREKKERTNGAKAAGAKSSTQQKGGNAGRGRREPQPPSWNRAVKRAAMLGIVVFFLFSLSAGKSSNRYVAALIPAVIYTALFIPFTYLIDRFAYRRFQARTEKERETTQRPAKKR